MGSNEGDRLAWLGRAVASLAHVGQVQNISALYETAAWGREEQPPFLNIALQLHTALPAHELLQATQQIEQQLGRERTIKWGPRTLDIDMLFYNDEVIDTPLLKVPHPYLHQRRFVLAPMAEIAPWYVHPVLHKTIAVLLDECTDTQAVTRVGTFGS
ncbi:2-amino-4-hydroxy-6-hydroxymethyldihydropteridine diphosphokinase [Nemorincola caseinilytica]|uniref:2-amino-4-hydroxy-6-hydroxymethyldihydropteridine pyrophosphokinase n=1 Tax=Nemorincola caseinilytica TaxID=2054315 RepID=A0ABP8NP86_9BACT